ncbi:MAG: hypothetical protein Kow0092_38270 [Deferrisomatales bacterium]
MSPTRNVQPVVQMLRRGVQVGVVVLVTGLVFLSLYSHYRAARALDDLPALGGPAGAVLPRIDRYVSSLEDPQRFLDDNKGTLWSLRLGGVDVTDPLAAVEVVAASKRVHGPLLVSILIPVLLTALLGRVFCSWLCPGYLLFELGGKVRALLRLVEIRPAEVGFSRRNKYVFLAVGLALAAFVSRPLFALVYPPAVVSRLVHGWVFGTAVSGAFVVLGAIVAFEVFVSPRWFCRTLCPGGALWALLGAGRCLRVRVTPERCTGCGRCRPVCEEGLDPVRESEGMECDNCGRCVRHCPEKALAYTCAPPWRGRGKVGRAAVPPLAALLACTCGLLAVGGARPARAHHILGLPHYSYKENYPQVPTLEYPATTGPYDVLLTSYPGKPVPGEPANLAFYVKNRQTGEPYGEPVGVRVLETFTFGDNRTVEALDRIPPFEQVHKITVTFPEEGEYVVELSLVVEGQTEVIPFAMVVGDPSSAWSVVAAVGLGLAAFLVVVRAVRIKRARRLAAVGRSGAG